MCMREMLFGNEYGLVDRLFIWVLRYIHDVAGFGYYIWSGVLK